jgi:hypothetical protein
MRALWLSLALLTCSQFSHGETITEVLQRSQAQRLAERGACSPDDLTARAAPLQASLRRLLAQHPHDAAVSLRLVGGDLFAEAVFDQPVIAVSCTLGALPEAERLLMLAHELGHLRLAHWQALNDLYVALIPGQVTPETTDPVANRLAREAHGLAHRQEFEADAFAYAMVQAWGVGLDDAFSLLTRQGVQADAATHPGTRRRLAQLRMLDARLGADRAHIETAKADVNPPR